MIAVDAHTRQYGHFYGLSSENDDRPLWIVLGDHQAEALRRVLDAVPDRPYRTMRIPSIRRLRGSDLPYLERAVAQASVLVSQPIRNGYRQLPIGVNQVAALMPAGSRTVTWPRIRYSGLFPFHVTVHNSHEPVSEPVSMPYHDVRTLMSSRTGLLDGTDLKESDWDVDVPADIFVEISDRSIAELARAENETTDVGVSDVLRKFGERSMHTITHPGNEVLVELAQRILDHEGVSVAACDPGKVLLGSIRAPYEERVLSALGITSRARTSWWTDGIATSSGSVRRAQMKWYAEHPQFVESAVKSHHELIELMGLNRG